MEISFKIKFSSAEETKLAIRFTEKTGEKQMEILLKIADNDYWTGILKSEEHPFHQFFCYSVIVKNTGMPESEYELAKGKINLKKYPEYAVITHENTAAQDFLKPDKIDFFKRVIKKVHHLPAFKSSKNPTHIFRGNFPVLQDDKFICIIGSGIKMNEWNNEHPVLFVPGKNSKSSIKINLSKEHFPLEYKLAVYDAMQKKIVAYETGPNRIIEKPAENETIHIIYCPHLFQQYAWKGAGVNVQLSSLKRNNGWGTGEFTDLHLLADWCCRTGIKMIQLLPINDTTTHATGNDSYPYAAISAFALHPQFLNLQKLADEYSYTIEKSLLEEGEMLNVLPIVNLAPVITLKLTVIKKIFAIAKKEFTEDRNWNIFFNENKNWLMPYAAFCCLRDTFHSVNHHYWKDFSLYNKDKVEQLAIPGGEYYEGILFWYFVQYHLHVQLKHASKYIHSKKIILKADLPIGVGRHSVDTWQHPEYFNLTMQAGAPPDAFSGKGQNWGFPTYNWDQIAFDNNEWFKKRLQYPQQYFDAIRIDHVLGLFRIWSIPLYQDEGLLGKFVPAIPMGERDFEHAGLIFEKEKYCMPFCNEEMLQQKFGDDVAEVKKLFFDGEKIKSAFDSQQKVRLYFDKNKDNRKWQQGLFDIITEVILLKDDLLKNAFHFRINMQQTNAFRNLPELEKPILIELYNQYFNVNQQELWKESGKVKLQMFKENTSMLLCAEDLGMVPDFTEELLHSMDILSLQVQQMPKKDQYFSETENANYETVVMPDTHDMATIREWWETHRASAQYFFNNILHEPGDAPYFCEPWVCKKIIEMHLHSPAMWSVFLLQDLLAVSGRLRRANPFEERINNPSDHGFVWNYKMHLTLETLNEQQDFEEEIKLMVMGNNR